LLLGLLAGAPAWTAQEPSEADVLKAQQKKALANWKKGLGQENPPHEETKHFLIYGTVKDKKLKELGPVLEKQYEEASRALQLTKDDLWKGKVAVYLIPDRRDFLTFVRRVEFRRVYAEEKGSASIDMDFPHVIAGPADGEMDLTADEQAGAQLGIALMKKKYGKFTPSWVEEGFGRATAIKTTSAQRKAQERSWVLRVVNKDKVKAQDAWGGGLDASEASVLRGSVIYYLAYSGRTPKFVPFLMGFRPTETVPEPTTEMVFRNLGVDMDRLHKVWRAWVSQGP
jgi:hypothetical protein